MGRLKKEREDRLPADFAYKEESFWKRRTENA